MTGTVTTTVNMDGELPTYPKYNYGAFINSPQEMGMTEDVPSGFGLDTIADNFGGVISYIDLLISGTGEASKAVSLFNDASTNEPLGNAYFYPSGLTCKDPSNLTQDVSAMMYMNNVPLGNIPFLSSFTGAGDIKEFRGLIPGMVEDLNGFNPMEFMYAMAVSPSDPCIKVSLPITNITSDGNNYDTTKDNKTQYKTENMFPLFVKLIDPCLFDKNADGIRTNPVSGKTCAEGFTNIGEIPNDHSSMLLDIYFMTIAVLFLFILMKMCKGTKR